MNICVRPSHAKGEVFAPPSKSMAHRLLICAALSEGESVIDNIAYSEDILATIDCLRVLGAEVETLENKVTVKGIKIGKIPGERIFKCRESGSTIRFFMGISMCIGGTSSFYGSKTLLTRPYSVYEDLCKESDLEFIREEESITIKGKLSTDDFYLPGNVSSQFITGLLYALPLKDKDSRIVFTTKVESASYIDLTLCAMKEFGVKVEKRNDGSLFIPGGQSYKAAHVVTEGDYSNAAFLDIYNIMGGDVKVKGLSNTSLQGDRVYRELFERLSKERAVIDISDCPDLGPILFVAAAMNHGALFTGTKRLKIKESDRGSVMCAELSKFGVKTKIEENSIEIEKCELKVPGEAISGHNDHRIVMAFTTILSLTGGRLEGAEAVRKSFPDYFERIKELGIEVSEDGMDQ